MAKQRPTITELENLVAKLRPEEKTLFERLFWISVVEGRMEVPESMRQWIATQFGSVEEVELQKIVKIVNQVTLQGAIFNGLRASRPVESLERKALEDRLDQGRRLDMFEDPISSTPADTFGRVRGNHCITASNVAKYDGLHSLAIFDEYIPFQFTRETLNDYIDTSLEWARRAQEEDPRASYFFLMWNCLWRSGASIIHGHFQMTLARDMHYAAIEYLRRCSLQYAKKHGSNYFDDLYQVHQLLDCAFQKDGIKVLVPLTPVKNKEIILMDGSLSGPLKMALYEVLDCYRQRMGVFSFNMALYLPPLGSVPEDWSGFPVQFRLVDRGDPLSWTSDIGAMELYAQPVISSDPFEVARLLREGLVH